MVCRGENHWTQGTAQPEEGIWLRGFIPADNTWAATSAHITPFFHPDRVGCAVGETYHSGVPCRRRHILAFIYFYF